MKLFLATAMGAALVAGCAPFEHGHYANDVSYQNNVGDPAGTPLVYRSGFSNGLAAVASLTGFGSSDTSGNGTQQRVSAAAHRDSPHLHQTGHAHGFGSSGEIVRSSSADDLGRDPFHKYFNRSAGSNFNAPKTAQGQSFVHIDNASSADDLGRDPFDKYFNRSAGSNFNATQTAQVQSFGHIDSASSADDLGRDPFDKYLKGHHHDGSRTHHVAQTQNFTVPNVAQASFAPVQVFPQTVQQSFVGQPIQQGFVNQPIQQVTLQQPVQQSFISPQVQQIAAQPVWPSAPQQTLVSPVPVQSFNAPTPIVSDIQVVPAAQSFFAPNPVPRANILASSLGSPHRFDADGYAICDIPGHKHAAHHTTQFKKKPLPKF